MWRKHLRVELQRGVSKYIELYFQLLIYYSTRTVEINARLNVSHINNTLFLTFVNLFTLVCGWVQNTCIFLDPFLRVRFYINPENFRAKEKNNIFYFIWFNNFKITLNGQTNLFVVISSIYIIYPFWFCSFSSLLFSSTHIYYNL